MKKITKLVLPVAGEGRRMRPLTLRTPKALVPLGGKPLLDYLLEEGTRSGIRTVILIINPKHKKYFEHYLRKSKVRFPNLTFHLRYQAEPLGNGHAVLQAADLIGNEPVAVRFCDDLIFAQSPALASLIEFYRAYKAPVLLLERVPRSKVSRYGVVGVRKIFHKKRSLPGGNLYRLTEIIEKPKPGRAPSNLIIIGGYILTPEIFRNLKKISDSLPNPGYDALPLAVALQVEFIVGGKVYGWEFLGTRLDCGTLEGLAQAEHFLAAQRS